MTITEQFTKEIDRHQMRVLREDGLYRHIRFHREGTMCMHFDLITWPGYLCYTGDMGTYVFRRLEDMFQFFRRESGEKLYRIDYRYWAEKVEGGDKGDGVERFDLDHAIKRLREYVTEHIADWDAEPKAALLEKVESEVFSYCEDEHALITNIRDFHHDRFNFFDFEGRLKVFSHRFLWCCHALAWAINQYDAARQPAAVSQGSAA